MSVSPRSFGAMRALSAARAACAAAKSATERCGLYWASCSSAERPSQIGARPDIASPSSCNVIDTAPWYGAHRPDDMSHGAWLPSIVLNREGALASDISHRTRTARVDHQDPA